MLVVLVLLAPPMGETVLQAQVVVLATAVVLLVGLVVLMATTVEMLEEVLAVVEAVEQGLLVEILLEHTI